MNELNKNFTRMKLPDRESYEETAKPSNNQKEHEYDEYDYENDNVIEELNFKNQSNNNEDSSFEDEEEEEQVAILVIALLKVHHNCC